MTSFDIRPDREQFVELSALAIFSAVAQERSLTGAAKQVGLTQPAVSQVLKHIENALGVSLVDRTTRPLRITPAGLRFQAYADAMLLEARRITAAVRHSAQTSFPRIRFGVVDSFASTFGPHIVKHLQSRVDQLTLRSGINSTIRDAFLAGELDLIVTTDSFDSETNLERHELFRDPFVLVTPSEYPGLTLDGLRRLSNLLPLIRYSRRSSFGVQIDVHLRRLGVEPPNRFEIDSSDALLSMVSAGHGWALTTPLCLLQGRHFLGKARVTSLPGPIASRRFNLMARKDHYGELPEQIASHCRHLLNEVLLPEVHSVIPWVSKQHFAVEGASQE